MGAFKKRYINYSLGLSHRPVRPSDFYVFKNFVFDPDALVGQTTAVHEFTLYLYPATVSLRHPIVAHLRVMLSCNALIKSTKFWRVVGSILSASTLLLAP